MSARLAQFLPEMDKFASYVLASEGSIFVDLPCSCGKGKRTTRCKDCLMHEPLCDGCFLRNHAQLPFHFAEKWNGLFFEKSAQVSLGRVEYLGHGGLPCPRILPGSEPLMLDVVELNGVHPCKVHYCKCNSEMKNWEQLLELELFPGSVSKTATAFSFAVLKHFDLLSSIGKTSAMDFVTTLRRTTNNAFPDEVPVSEMISVIRINSNLNLLAELL